MSLLKIIILYGINPTDTNFKIILINKISCHNSKFKINYYTRDMLSLIKNLKLLYRWKVVAANNNYYTRDKSSLIKKIRIILIHELSRPWYKFQNNCYKLDKLCSKFRMNYYPRYKLSLLKKIKKLLYTWKVIVAKNNYYTRNTSSLIKKLKKLLHMG